jgi:hypothetical protein
MVRAAAKTPAKTVRFSQELFDCICERIADGGSLRAICGGKSGMPDRATFNRWRKRKPELQQQYDAACIEREEAIFDDIQFIADTARDPQKARNQIDARKWRLARMNRKKYGDRVTNEHTGEGGGPVVIAATNLDEKL